MRPLYGVLLYAPLLLVLLGPGLALAASPSHELALFHSHSSLSNNLSDWSDWRLLWQQRQTLKNPWSLELNDIYHFGVRDQNITLGREFYRKPGLRLHTAASVSTAHSLYPSFSVAAGSEAKLKPALILFTDLKFSHFDKLEPMGMQRSGANSTRLNARLDYYRGAHLYSYSLYYTYMQGQALTASAASHNLKYAYIYNDYNNISLSLATGSEVDFDPANAALSISEVDSISIGGMHWMRKTLAIVYTLATHNVSSTNFGYRRNELYLGLRKLY